MRNGKNDSKEMTWIRYRLNKMMLWNERRKTLKQLSALNSHMLRDIGLERAQIEATVDQINEKQTRRWQEQRRSDQQARAARDLKRSTNICTGAGSAPV